MITNNNEELNLIKFISQASEVYLIKWIQKTGRSITKERTRTSVVTALLGELKQSGNYLLPGVTSKAPKSEICENFVNGDLAVAKLADEKQAFLDLPGHLRAGTRRERKEARAGCKKKKKCERLRHM